MKDSMEEARRWFAQAENDLQFAKLALQEAYYSQCCFISQQAAEKATKAIHYHQGARIVIGHSIFQLMAKFSTEAGYGELKDKAKLLDQFYIASRYPNGIPGGAPFEMFTKKQAQEAVHSAEQILHWAQKTTQPNQPNQPNKRK